MKSNVQENLRQCNELSVFYNLRLKMHCYALKIASMSPPVDSAMLWFSTMYVRWWEIEARQVKLCSRLEKRPNELICP